MNKKENMRRRRHKAENQRVSNNRKVIQRCNFAYKVEHRIHNNKNLESSIILLQDSLSKKGSKN